MDWVDWKERRSTCQPRPNIETVISHFLPHHHHYPLTHHFCPGDTLPKRAEQGDVERRGQLDDHLHRQAGVHLLRGDGPREDASDARAPRAQPLPQRWRGRRHAGAHRRVLQPAPPRLVRRRRVGDDVPELGEYALRRAGHLPVPRRLAVGSTTNSSARHPGETLQTDMKRNMPELRNVTDMED